MDFYARIFPTGKIPLSFRPRFTAEPSRLGCVSEPFWLSHIFLQKERVGLKRLGDRRPKAAGLATKSLRLPQGEIIMILFKVIYRSAIG